MKPYASTPFDLEGKVCFISGAAGLLGQEFARALASAGAKLFLADVRADSLKSLANSLQKDFPQLELECAELNVASESSAKKCAAQCQKKFGRIDVLVNSAAIDPKFDASFDATKFSKFADFPLEKWEESLQVNLTGAFLLTQAVAPYLEQQGEGSIIFLGSNYGLVGPDQRIYRKKGQETQTYKPAVYSVSKAGLIGLTKYLAVYYAGTKIRVNMLTPSGVFNNHEPEFTANYSERTVMRRMSKREEYHGAILFLCSEASSYMTGGNLVIDGGWTAL